MSLCKDKPLIAGSLLIVLAFALASFVSINTARWIQDDTFIFLQYARNLIHGEGLVFNAGERVCGVTSPLWTALLGPLFLVSDDPAQLATLLSALFGGAALVALIGLFPRPERATAGLAAAALLLLSPPFRVWAISGMETSLFLFLIVLSLTLVRRRQSAWTGLVVGLCMLTRPEGYLLAVAHLVGLLIRKERPSGILRAAITAIAVVAPWWIFSWSYFGSVIPQSVLAKKIVYAEVLFNTSPMMTLKAFLAGGPISLLLTILAVVGLAVSRDRVRRHIDIITFGFLYLVFYMVGRTFIHDWYILPITLVCAYGAGLAVAAIGARAAATAPHIGVFSTRRLTGIGMVLVVCAALVPMTSRAVHVLDAKQQYIESTLCQVAKFSREWPRDGSIFLNAIGCVGYYGDRHVIDSLGLVSPGVLPSCRRRAWVEPIREFSPEIVVLGPTAGTAEIEADPWFRANYRASARFEADPELAKRGGTYARSYRVFVRRAT